MGLRLLVFRASDFVDLGNPSSASCSPSSMFITVAAVVVTCLVLKVNFVVGETSAAPLRCADCEAWGDAVSDVVMLDLDR